MAWHKRAGWKRLPVSSGWSRRIPAGWPRASGWVVTPRSQQARNARGGNRGR